jgi:hypothetical protein
LFINIDNLKSFYNRDDFDIASEETLSNGLSKFITFQNKKITTFINIVSNKVDVIDDISGSFTGIGTTTSANLLDLTSFRLTLKMEVKFHSLRSLMDLVLCNFSWIFYY